MGTLIEQQLGAMTDHIDGLRFRKIWDSGGLWYGQFIFHFTSYEKWFSTKGYDSPDDLLDALTYILEDTNMTNIFKMTGDLFKYLTAEMINSKDINLTIIKVESEELENQRGKQTRPILFFQETDKGMVLGNKTNVRSMVALYGTEVDDWIGQRIAIYRTTIQAFGKTQPVLRIREDAPAAKQRKPVAVAVAHEPEEIDWDDLPDAETHDADHAPDPSTNSTGPEQAEPVVADIDWREKVTQANGQTTLGLIADCAANACPYYESEEQVLDAMKEYGMLKGVKITRSLAVENDGALALYDWLLERASAKADEVGDE